MNTQKKNEIIDTIIHDLEALDFNSKEAREVVGNNLDLLSKEKEQEIVEIVKAYKIEEVYKGLDDYSRGMDAGKNYTVDDILSKLTPSDREIL